MVSLFQYSQEYETNQTHRFSRGNGQAARELVNLLGGDPFVTARTALKQLGVAFNTAVRALGQLETVGIIKELKEAKRQRVWCCQALLDILQEPARLTPEHPPS
jgi:Fic family protein